MEYTVHDLALNRLRSQGAEKRLILAGVFILQICVLLYLFLERLQRDRARFRNAQVI